MTINTRFHLLKSSPFFKPSANLSKFPRASHFSTSDNTNLRLNHGGGRKFSNIPPLECNSEISSLYSLQILFKSPRASHFSTISTNNYTNLRLNRGGGGSKFSTILPLRSNSEVSLLSSLFVLFWWLKFNTPIFNCSAVVQSLSRASQLLAILWPSVMNRELSFTLLVCAFLFQKLCISPLNFGLILEIIVIHFFFTETML